MDIPPDKAFNERADALLDLANSQLQDASVEQVSGSIAFAAAAFNSWMCLALSADKEKMAAGRVQIISDLTHRFRTMLEDNYDHYLASYDSLKTSTPRGQQ